MIKVKTFTFNPLEENTFVVYDDSGFCIIFDPGCYEKQEKEELRQFINDNQLQVKSLINTHCHMDHVLGNKFVKDVFDVPLGIHRLEEEPLRSVGVYAPAFGFTHYEPAEPDLYLEEGEIVDLGDDSLQVLFVPGHAPGHIAFINEKSKICIGGDVLFRGSIGRTDLPGGDFDTLIASIHQKFFALDDATTVYCGHGPATTIGLEKESNPFCALKV